MVIDDFNKRNLDFINKMNQDDELKKLSREWFTKSTIHEYSYHFTWMGRPIIQYPQDIVALQELIWMIKPDLIIETGIAHGGSLILSSSMLELIGNGGRVVGVDIEIRPHNRKAIESHPMYKNITLMEGSSTDSEIADAISKIASDKKAVMVILDSNHTESHVLEELRIYAPLVTKGSYCVVFDTVIEMMPKGSYPNRPWEVGDNPWTAVKKYLQETDRFEIDASIPNKLQITVAPDGYLKCVK